MLSLIRLLCQLGMSMRQVVTNYLRECMASLHQLPHSMWVYEGPSNVTRLSPDGPLELDLLNVMVKFLCGGGTSAVLPPRVRTLWADDYCDALIASLPDSDE